MTKCDIGIEIDSSRLACSIRQLKAEQPGEPAVC